MGKQVKHTLTAIIKDKKGNILSIGKNSYFKTHPLMYKINKSLGNHQPHKVYLHAEIDSIIKCSNIDKAYSIEIYRYTKAGYGLSYPCPICRLAIQQTNIRYIIYIDKDKNLVKEKLY